jgi:hypothetical protein
MYGMGSVYTYWRRRFNGQDYTHVNMEWGDMEILSDCAMIPATLFLLLEMKIVFSLLLLYASFLIAQVDT